MKKDVPKAGKDGISCPFRLLIVLSASLNVLPCKNLVLNEERRALLLPDRWTALCGRAAVYAPLKVPYIVELFVLRRQKKSEYMGN